MPRCPSCGHQVGPGETKCSRCGFELKADSPFSAGATRPRSGGLVWVVLGGGILIALLIFAAARLGWLTIPTLSPPPSETSVSAGPTRNTSVRLSPVVSEVLEAPRVYDHDEFLEFVVARWYASGPSVAVTDGHLSINGVQPWASWWGTVRTFEEGDAVLVLFQPGVGSQIEFHLERGDWATDDYRRWAFHVGTRFEMSISEGSDPQRWGELVGQLALDPQEWYYLLLGIDPTAEFVAFVWEQDAPAPQLEYRRRMDDSWAGPGWVFGAGANRGEAAIDAVTEIAFANVRTPDGAGERFWSALALLDQQRPDDALEELDAALALDPDNAVYLYYRGITEWRMGQIDRAAAALERASAQDPENDEYLRSLAWLHATERDDPDVALAYIDEALSLAPLEARNYRQRALIVRDVARNLQEALADLDRAIELSPLEAELYRLRGETYNQMGDYGAGLRDGIQCAELQPEDAACYLQQARSHRGLGDQEGAVAAYSRFLDTTDRFVCTGCRDEALDYIAQSE